MTVITNEYFKRVQPQASSSPVPSGSEMVAYDYRGFIITRGMSEYMLWEITLKEGVRPPVPLRGSFTKKIGAEATIDDFLEKEAMKKLEAK